jgi:LPS sulfotransferase NodH
MNMPAVLLSKLRAMDGSREPSERELLEQAFPELRYIWLWREDTLAQAVSFSRALQTREWISPQRPVREPRFDFEHIQGCWGDQEGEQRMGTVVHGQQDPTLPSPLPGDRSK